MIRDEDAAQTPLFRSDDVSTRYDEILQALCPGTTSTEATLKALAKARHKDLRYDASAVIVRYLDERGTIVTRFQLVTHDDFSTCAFVLGAHPRCDLGSLPGAADKHVLIFGRSAAIAERDPRVDIFALETGLDTAGCRAQVGGLYDRCGRLDEEHAPISFVIGDTLVWVVQFRAGEAAPALWSLCERPGDSAQATRPFEDPETFCHRPSDAPIGRQPLVSMVRQSLFESFSRDVDDWVASTDECQRESATMAGTATRTDWVLPDMSRRDIKIWLTDDDFELGVVLGRSPGFARSEDVFDVPTLSRRHAYLFVLDDGVYFVDLASTHGSAVYVREQREAALDARGRVFRLDEGARVSLAGFPVRLYRWTG